MKISTYYSRSKKYEAKISPLQQDWWICNYTYAAKSVQSKKLNAKRLSHTGFLLSEVVTAYNTFQKAAACKALEVIYTIITSAFFIS